jgi:hypothetical protein
MLSKMPHGTTEKPTSFGRAVILLIERSNSVHSQYFKAHLSPSGISLLAAYVAVRLKLISRQTQTKMTRSRYASLPKHKRLLISKLICPSSSIATYASTKQNCSLTVVTPVGIPRVRNQPVWCAIFNAPAKHSDSMSTKKFTSHMFVNACREIRRAEIIKLQTLHMP